MKQTTRSLISLLVLLAVAAGAGLFAYFGVLKKQEAEKEAKEKKEKLFADLDKAKVQGLTVTAKGQTTVLAPKKPEGWQIVSPVQSDADKGTVDSLLDRLVSIKSKSVVEEQAKDLSKYGLDKPSVRIVAKVDGGKELVLRAGVENTFDNSVYVAVNDSNDVLQAENAKWAFEKDTFELRDKRVMPFEDAKVQALEVRVGDQRWAVKKVDNRWQIDQPTPEPAEDTTVNRVLGSLRSLNATKFVTDTAGTAEHAQYGLETPRLEAAVTLDGGARMTLLAGQTSLIPDAGEGAATGTRSYARRREATFIAEIPDSLFKDLEVPAADLKDKTVVAIDKDKVFGLKFAMGSDSLTAERAKPQGDAGPGDDWKLSSAGAGKLKDYKVSSVLWVLSSLKGSKIVEDAPADLARYGLDKPVRTVTALDGDGKELGTLLVGRDEGENTYVKNAASPRVFEVEKSRLTDVPATRGDLEEAPPAAPDAGAK